MRIGFASACVLCLVAMPMSKAQSIARASPNRGVSLHQEISVFMESYATALSAHDRKSVINHYDPAGSWRLGDGKKSFLTAAALANHYRTAWKGPTFFKWHDLTYQAIGSDSAVVYALFTWGGENGSQLKCDYSALLRRRAGELKIRSEHESCVALSA